MNIKSLYKSVILFLSILIISAYNGEVCAQSWGFGKNKVQYTDFEWQVLKTPHFDIHFSEGYLDLAGRSGAMLEDGYRDVSRRLEHNIQKRIPVIIYGSHSAFQQTNTTWSLIPEGVQAFAEPNRGRIVIHFSGSNRDYRNTAVHELIHIFEFDIIYGNLLQSVFSRSMLFRIPLWLAEGCSEYYSKGYDDEAEMFMRDAAIFDYLPRNLDYTGGYMVYKAGQSVIDYIVRTYGQRKMVDIMNRLGTTRSIERALNETIGLSTEDLTRNWAKSVRRRYWPFYADKMDPEEYGRRLTDHKKNHYYRNVKPIISPDGENIVYYSDREGLDGIYLMNAVTGEIEKTLIKGQMSEEFESLRIIKSNLAISPKGDKIAFVAKSNGFDKLFLMGIPGKEIVNKIKIPLDFFYSPSWSPGGDTIAFVGVTGGQTDLYLYRISDGRLDRLTRDVEDEKDPSWFPDGKKLVYCRSPRVVPNPEYGEAGNEMDITKINIDYFHTKIKKGLSSSDVWSVEIATGVKKRIFETKGDDSSPIIVDGGKEIVFASNEIGIWNLYRGSVELGKYYRFT
ncbi:PD40 domain-containing protein, partial [bacterium]|nr:PD40 domain-containing protein [bacterium]